MLSDPDRPSRISPCALSRRFPVYCAFDSFVLASAFLTSPPVYAVTRLNCFRKVRTSLRPTEFLVYASSGSFDFRSLLPIYITLSMVGWLCLYLRGLSPHQKTSSFAWRTRKLPFSTGRPLSQKRRRFQVFLIFSARLKNFLLD